MLESSAFQGQDAPLERVQPVVQLIRLSLSTDGGLGRGFSRAFGLSRSFVLRGFGLHGFGVFLLRHIPSSFCLRRTIAADIATASIRLPLV